MLWIADPFIKNHNPYDEEFYAPLMEAFYEHTADRYISKSELLDRYYPGQADTISALAGALIPGLYAAPVRDAVQRREIAAESIDAEIDVNPGISAGLPAETLGADTVAARNRTSPGPPSAPDKRVNINTAGIAELTRLPGIGPAMAERIVGYRVEHGPFRSVEDIVKVRGIGPARLEQLRDLIEV